VSGTASKPTKGRKLRLRLYVAGESPNSAAAVRNLRTLLAAHPSREVELDIVDVLKDPESGARDGVLVTPMLIKLGPAPERRIFGSLTDTAALLGVLGLVEAP
jgi:circadian clock protein KaiB